MATTSFVLWIKLWHGVDWLAFGGQERARQAAANGELPAPRGLGARFPGLRRYRLQDRAAPNGIAKPNKWYGSSTLVGVKEGRRVYVPEWLQEMFLYVAPIALIATFTDAFAPRRAALAMGAPTVGRIAFDIAGALFLYDTYFFISHLALHKLPAKLYHWTHGKHHVNRDCRASDTVRLTPVEEFADVMCSILALRTMGAHPLSRGLYNFVIVGLLVELHAGGRRSGAARGGVEWRSVGWSGVMWGEVGWRGMVRCGAVRCVMEWLGRHACTLILRPSHP